MTLTTSCFKLSYVGTAATRQATFSTIFVPPAIINDENVYLRLVSAEASTGAATKRIPCLIKLDGLPFPHATSNISVGTSIVSESVKGTEIGFVCINGVSQPGPRILTHIPNGPQELRFSIQPLEQATDLIATQTEFVLMLEFAK